MDGVRRYCPAQAMRSRISSRTDLAQFDPARAHLSRRRLCPKFGSGRASVHSGTMPRADVDDPEAPDVVRAVHGRAVQVQQTCGDGACGVHAVFGTSHNGEYIKANARTFLREPFGAPSADFFSIVSDITFLLNT